MEESCQARDNDIEIHIHGESVSEEVSQPAQINLTGDLAIGASRGGGVAGEDI